MLGQLKFAPWEYTLAFGGPCIGGLIGSRLSRRLVNRFGQHRIMLVFGTLSACWPVGLASIGPAPGGLVLVIGLQFCLVLCMGVFNPVSATYRLEHTEKHLVARVLAAWSVSTSLTTAALTALWGVLASLTSPRIAIAAAGVLLLATPLLPPRREHSARPDLAPEATRGLSGKLPPEEQVPAGHRAYCRLECAQGNGIIRACGKRLPAGKGTNARIGPVPRRGGSRLDRPSRYLGPGAVLPPGSRRHATRRDRRPAAGAC